MLFFPQLIRDEMKGFDVFLANNWVYVKSKKAPFKIFFTTPHFSSMVVFQKIQMRKRLSFPVNQSIMAFLNTSMCRYQEVRHFAHKSVL